MFRYSEAYCRIPLADLYRAFDRGDGKLVWRDEAGHLLGSAKVASRFSGVLRLAFDIAGSDWVEAFSGELAISLDWRAAGLHRQEPYARCPSCQQPAKLLIAKSHAWKCARCHQLVNRGTYLRSNVRLSETVEALRAQVGAGRPRGMHNTTYQKLRFKLKEAEDDLGPELVTADSRYVHIVRHIVGTKSIPNAIRRKATSGPANKLFQKRLFDHLNNHFVGTADRILEQLVFLKQEGFTSGLIEQIALAAKLRPLVLGREEELVVPRTSGHLERTIVEVPFLGDPSWFRFCSAVAERLPPIQGDIDEQARVVRFSWNGSADDRLALRVQIDETLAIVRAHVAHQETAIDRYNHDLHLNATKYLKTKAPKTPAART